jgi:hypothetical protein
LYIIIIIIIEKNHCTIPSFSIFSGFEEKLDFQHKFESRKKIRFAKQNRVLKKLFIENTSTG